MMRFMGVLVGSALAVAALVVFVGIPEFTTESSVVEDTVITLPMRAESPAPDPEPVAAPRETPQQVPVAAQIAVPADPPAPSETVVADTEVTPAPAVSAPSGTDAALQWYAFWSPFRSELAANGFVSKLQESTGIDYRVVKVKTGVYEVAFAYSDDEDIQDKLARISAATGLDMSDS